MIDPAWIDAGSKVLAAAVSAPPAGPAISGGAPVTYGQDIDFSGFTVGTGSSRVTGAPNNKTTSPAAGAGAGATGTGASGWGNIAVLGGLALLGYLALS